MTEKRLKLFFTEKNISNRELWETVVQLLFVQQISAEFFVVDGRETFHIWQQLPVSGFHLRHGNVKNTIIVGLRSSIKYSHYKQNYFG